MSHMTQLFVFSPFSSAGEQLKVLFERGEKRPSKIAESARIVYGTPDFKIVNMSEDDQSFEPLKIEQVRDLQLEVTYPPIDHDLRVIVIGNLELASLPAQHALLKLLEEPPEYLQVIVTTSEPGTLLPTILSRCEVIRLQDLAGTASQPAHQLPPELLTALDALPTKTLTLGSAFRISDRYKERPDALMFVSELISYLHQTTWYPTSELAALVSACLVATKRLKQNVNPRLVIEELLFELVRRNE